MISRFGSLVLEPLLLKIGFIKFESYDNFISASETDDKIDVLSEVNNMYRTMCSLSVSLIVVFSIDSISLSFPWFKENVAYILGVGLAILFFVAYRKQTGFVVARVKKATEAK